MINEKGIFKLKYSRAHKFLLITQDDLPIPNQIQLEIISEITSLIKVEVSCHKLPIEMSRNGFEIKRVIYEFICDDVQSESIEDLEFKLQRYWVQE